MKSGKKDYLEELREENERLKKELEIARLEKENKEMREEINHLKNPYTPYTPFIPSTPRSGTITLCTNSNFFEDD